MTCVIPTAHILDLLDGEKLRDMREKNEQLLEKTLGSAKGGPKTEASARAGSAPSIKPDNPSHNEDFTGLLGAATAKRQSDDQT